MGVTLFVLRKFLTPGLYSIAVLIIVGAATYFAAIFAMVGLSLIDDLKKVSGVLLHRNENKDLLRVPMLIHEPKPLSNQNLCDNF